MYKRQGQDRLVGTTYEWISITTDVVWTPDSQWIFYVDADRGLVAQERDTVRAVHLSGIRNVRALAVRAAPSP